MTDIHRIGTTSRLSGAVVHGGLVYLAGQVPDSLGAPIEQQTQEVLNKIDALLAQAGSDTSRLLSAQIWVSDISQYFAGMNSVWQAWLPEGCAPARATVEATLARPGIDVEIMLVAAVR
jgi:enamine deaminase RidA (YjgF/YER057c/UK114 family)